ncbi:hypothetical protein [Bacillus altitudinis]|uniref:hypothetical protein n=1 Tax=Bacillus altitudinis TaxID=293387 RepID=UPI00030DBFB0|nr:hypothetical protein [Bacillus altitudinis]
MFDAVTFEKVVLFIGSGIIPIVGLFLSLSQNRLKRKKEFQESQQQNYNFIQNGYNNAFNVAIQHNQAQEHYYYHQQKKEDFKEKQKILNSRANFLESVMTFTFFGLIIIVAFNEISSSFEQFNIKDTINYSYIFWDSFQIAGTSVIHASFGLIVAVFLSSLLTRNALFRNLFIITITTLANIKTLNFWSNNPIDMKSIQKNATQVSEQITINSIIDHFMPFLLVIHVITAAIVTFHITKILYIPEYKVRSKIFIFSLGFYILFPFLYGLVRALF